MPHQHKTHNIFTIYKKPTLGTEVKTSQMTLKKSQPWDENLQIYIGWDFPFTPEQIALILGEDVIQPRELVPEMTRMTSNFGVRISPIDHVRKMHTGIDISAPTGTPVNAWRDGTVVFASRRGGYGNMVAIRHADGSESYYAHLHGLSVIEGDIVEEGTQIGTVGNTGDSTGPHLHFEIRIKRRPINPLANADRHHQVSQTP